jgi:penicillin-binding protein 2
MARLYGGIATGKLVTPHLLASVQRDNIPIRLGISKAPKAIASGPDFNQKLNIIRQGLYMATHDPIGTSSAVFSSFPVPIAGKTGTAEKWSNQYQRNFNQAWWCGYGPTNQPKLVVCAVIENGGHGGTAAAPAALEVFQQFFGVKNTYTVPTQTD